MLILKVGKYAFGSNIKPIYKEVKKKKLFPIILCTFILNQSIFTLDSKKEVIFRLFPISVLSVLSHDDVGVDIETWKSIRPMKISLIVSVWFVVVVADYWENCRILSTILSLLSKWNNFFICICQRQGKRAM